MSHCACLAPQRRRLLLFACALTSARGSEPASTGCHRRVYLDLGANWANTLRLHTKLQHHVRRATLAAMNGTCTYEWEVYAFEASPIMHPFVEAFVKFLNGKGPRPSLTVPPVGGSIQMLEYARRFGCPSRHVRSEYPKMYECMNRVFSKAYAAFKVDPALNDTALIQHRLHEAAHPNVASLTRFTFVPAAVGASASALDMSWPYGVLLTTDMHNLAADVPVPAGVPAGARVQVVDFVRWFGERFSKADLVIVKMDVEGAEHQIVKRMANAGLLESIDVLGLECHGPHDRCSALTRTVTQHGVRMVSEAASSGLMGVDPYSHPKDMMPIDPRPRA